MKFEPILKVKIKKFKNDFGYQTLDDSSLFERFINNLLLTMHQPGATTKNTSLLEMTSVGGQNDMGIDGIAIKVNGIFITSKKEIDNIISLNKQISVEFIFIQSKNKDKTDVGEYSKFADGIYDFLSEEHFEPHNDKISALLYLKDYIFSDEIIQSWKEAPIIRIYYVIFGEWRENLHISGKSQALHDKIDNLNDYGDIHSRFFGASNIVKICEENDNCFKIVLNVLGSLEFEEVEDVTNSQVILCRASEFVKLLNTEEGVIRKSLFMDNVRDYQGRTYINEAMLETIQQDPSAFLLRNNGITIVCTDLVSSNRKVTITNPQIVNGCQTSNVIFFANQLNYDLTEVYVLVKIIATEKNTITNSIVKGTNSQNPVFTESFEITREFHKQLEEFINAIQINIPDVEEKIFYERRSKQYEANPLIKKHRTFGLDVLAHCVISIFLQAPHDSVLHIVNLLEKYQNTVFVDEQSFYPFYASVLLCLNFERLINKDLIDRKYDTYKFFILSIASEKIAGGPLDINSRNVDKACEKLIECASNENELIKISTEAITIFEKTKELWINKQGDQYRHGIKDNPTFTKFLWTHLRGGNVDKIDFNASESDVTHRGKVLSAKQDRAGRYYGFIKGYPDNIFFHSEDNPQIDFSSIIGKTVTYALKYNPVNGKIKAKNVNII